ATTVRQTSGVTAATQVLHSTVWIGKHHYRAQGVTPSGLDATMNLGVTAGSIDKLGKRTVALSTTTANSLGKQVGGTLTMRLGDGTPAHLHVVAIYTRGLGFGALTLPYHLLAAHVDNPTAATVLIAAPTTARPALHALAAGHKGIRLSDQTTVSAESTSSGNAMVRYLALGLIIAFTAISVVNTLAIATIDRRRELALLRRVGATRRQILRMLRAETLAALVTALVLGAAIGGATLAGFAAGITGSTTPTVTATVAAAIVAAAAVLSYLGTAIPARAIMRTTRNR
ncbi:MAG: FtsX-like permease family protein, partial [Nocardioidaceae bacterium]